MRPQSLSILLICCLIVLLGCQPRINTEVPSLPVVDSHCENKSLTVYPPLNLTVSFCSNFSEIREWSECINAFAVRDKDPSLCGRITFPANRDNCLLEATAAKTNLSACLQLNNTKLAWFCVREVAYRTLNSSICDYINDSVRNCALVECNQTLVDYFGQECYSALAKETKDISLCRKLYQTDVPHNFPSPRDQCIYTIAKEGSNISPCNEMINTDWREGCISAIAKNLQDDTLCGQLTMYENRNSCYVAVAVNLSSPLQCTKSESQEGRDFCYLSIAESTGNYSLCDQIVTSRNTCKIIAATKSSDCSELDSINRDTCYIRFYEYKQDYSVCEYIQNVEQKGYCYLRAAKFMGDRELCRKASALSTDCLQDWAIDNCNLQLCQEMTAEKSVSYDQCLASIARKTNNQQLCTQISSDSMKRECYTYFANLTNDLNLCLNLSRGLFRDSCFLNLIK